MIARIEGTLLARELDHVEVMTAGGVAYELAVPLGVYEKLPAIGERVALHTHLVVKEDGWQLFGFATSFERRVFRRLLDAKGVGPALALGMISSLTGERLVRALSDRDIATLQSVPRVGRKKAEQIILDLSDKLDDLSGAMSAPTGTAVSRGVDDAIRALVSLGYSQSDADRAVRATIDDGGREFSATEIIRASLARIRA